MIPDDRLRELLQRSEDEARPDPAFMDGLFEDLKKERRPQRRWFGSLVPSLGWAFAPMVVLGALVVVVLLPNLRGGQVGPGSSGEPSPSPSGVPTATAARPTSSEPAVLCGGLEGLGCTNEPGRKVADQDPRWEFTLRNGWSHVEDTSTYSELTQGRTRYFWVVYQPGADKMPTESPDDIMAIIQGQAGATTTDPIDINIDGASGRQVDITTTQKAQSLFISDVAAVSLEEFTKSRVIALDVTSVQGTRHHTVVFVVSAASADDFNASIALAQPILDSITWAEVQAAGATGSASPTSSP